MKNNLENEKKKNSGENRRVVNKNKCEKIKGRQVRSHEPSEQQTTQETKNETKRVVREINDYYRSERKKENGCTIQIIKRVAQKQINRPVSKQTIVRLKKKEKKRSEATECRHTCVAVC